MNWSEFPHWTGNRVIQVNSKVGGLGGIFLELNDFAVIPENNLNTLSQLSAIAAGIFVEHNMNFETWQDMLDPPIARTGFSEEDLPSDLIGFYFALQLESGMDYGAALEELDRICKLMKKEDSQSIYDEEYQ